MRSQPPNQLRKWCVCSKLWRDVAVLRGKAVIKIQAFGIRSPKAVSIPFEHHFAAQHPECQKNQQAANPQMGVAQLPPHLGQQRTAAMPLCSMADRCQRSYAACPDQAVNPRHPVEKRQQIQQQSRGADDHRHHSDDLFFRIPADGKCNAQNAEHRQAKYHASASDVSQLI